MHVTLVEINVHEDKVDEFIEVFRQNHLGSVQEEGNLRFDVLQDPEVNSRFYIYEAYKDEDAVAFHKTTPHYKTKKNGDGDTENAERCEGEFDAQMRVPRQHENNSDRKEKIE